MLFHGISGNAERRPNFFIRKFVEPAHLENFPANGWELRNGLQNALVHFIVFELLVGEPDIFLQVIYQRICMRGQFLAQYLKDPVAGNDI